MQSHSLSCTSLCWSYSISTPPTTHLTKFFKELSVHHDPPLLTIQSSKLSSDLVTVGIQRQPKKELSRILRTDAAIEAIERKANSKKYNKLWPRAVLEALDDAIKENRWESALKVCWVCWEVIYCFSLFVFLLKIIKSLRFCISGFCLIWLMVILFVCFWVFHLVFNFR